MVCPRNPRGCRRCWVKWLLSFDLSHPHNWRLKIWDIHNNAQYEYFNQCEIFSNLFLRNKRVILWNLNLLLVKTENFISFNIYPLKVFESLPVFNQYIRNVKYNSLSDTDLYQDKNRFIQNILQMLHTGHDHGRQTGPFSFRDILILDTFVW